MLISFEDVKSSVHYQEDTIRGILPDKTTLTILPQDEAETFWSKFYILQPNGFSDLKTEAVLKIGVMNLDMIEDFAKSRAY